jgi:hypothetical protein
MLIAGLFTITKKCAHNLTSGKKIYSAHRGILFIHKKKESLSFAITWMELEIIRVSEISQA